MYFNYEQVEEKKNTVSTLFEKYQKNAAAVSEEDKNGKYKNAFIKLRKDIAYAMADFAMANALSVYIPEGSSLVTDAAGLVSSNLSSVLSTLYKNGFAEAVDMVEEIRDAFLSNFYFKTVA